MIRRAGRRLLTPVAIVAAGLALAIAVYFTLQHREQSRYSEEARSLAREALSHVETRVISHVSALNRMAIRWESAPGTADEIWQTDAQLYITDIPHIQSIVWSDENMVIRRVVDRENRDFIVGRDQGTLPGRRAQIGLARRSGKAASSGPRELMFGGMGFIYDLPLTYPDGASGGYLHGVFSYASLLDEQWDEVADRYWFRLTVDGVPVAEPTQATDAPPSAVAEADLLGERWALSLVPKRPGVPADRQQVPFILACLCFFLGLLAGMAVYFRARAVDRANLYLTTHRRLQVAIHALQSPFAYFDSEDRLQNWNRAFSELHRNISSTVRRGVKYETLVRSTVEAGLLQEAIGREEEFIAERMALHALPEFTIDRELSPGRWIRTEERRAGDGGTTTLWMDVSEQKNRQAALENLNAELIAKHAALEETRRRLKTEEERFRTFAESSADFFWESDADHIMFWFSDNFEGVGSRDRNWYIGRSRLKMAPHDINDPAWAEHLRKLAAREPFRDVIVRHDHDAETVWIRSAGVPQFDADGQFTGYLGIGTNVTELMLAEERYSIVRGQLEMAINSIPDGMLIFSPDDRLLLSNQNWRHANPGSLDLVDGEAHFADLLRRSAEVGLPAHFTDEECEAWYRQRVSLRDRPGAVLEFETREGTWCRVSDSRTADGGTVSVRTDITDLKLRQMELEAERNKAESANRAKTEFLTNMSHELRTPLNAIIGFADVMGTGMFGALSDRYQGYAGDIGDSGRHLLSLINDLLDSAKIESGTMELTPEEAALDDLVEHSSALLQPMADEAGVTLKSDIGPDFRLFVDSRGIRQILINLMSNAVKFSMRGGEVIVSASRRADGIEVCVSDSGIGIDEDDLQRVFDRFVQIQDSLSRTHAGTGIGLPLSRSLAEMHQGTLTLESEVGTGTRAILWLPEICVRESADQVARQPSAESMTG